MSGYWPRMAPPRRSESATSMISRLSNGNLLANENETIVGYIIKYLRK
jgi:hypothetical protein